MVNLINPSRGYSYNLRYKPFEEKHLQYIRDNKDRYSMVDIAKQLGFTNTTVFKYANHFGLKSTYRKPRTKQQIDKAKVACIMESFANTYNLTDTATIVGVSVPTVSKVISQYWLFKKESESTQTITLKSKV